MSLKIIDNEKLLELKKVACTSDRKRTHFNLHESLDSPVQRLCVVFEQETYVRPHRHVDLNKWEMFILLEGNAAVLIFDDAGKVTALHELNKSDNYVVEIPPNTWHTLIARDKGATLMEIKEGPYTPVSDKDFAVWAPQENAFGTELCIRWLQSARVGDCYQS